MQGQYKRALGGGLSLADLARQQGVDPAQLRETMLAAGRVRIATPAGEGALTGDGAAEQERRLVARVDQQFA